VFLVVHRFPPKALLAAGERRVDVTPGRYLKEVRERLQIGLREVQEASSAIATEEGNENFYVSAARLTQIENEQSIPSFFKLFSLCAIYGLDLHDVLSRYGVNANRALSYRSQRRRARYPRNSTGWKTRSWFRYAWIRVFAGKAPSSSIAWWRCGEKFPRHSC